jgi:hypothetical protein
MQIGFMNLVVMPLFDELFNLVKCQNPSRLDSISAICGLLVDNHTHWNMERNMRASLRGENLGADDQKTVMSDGSELYIPAPASKQPNISPAPDAINFLETSPDLIQRVYSSELKRSSSGSVKAPPADTHSSSGSSAISLTYSQAHGYDSDTDHV